MVTKPSSKGSDDAKCVVMFPKSYLDSKKFQVMEGSIFQIPHELLGEAEEVTLMEWYKNQNGLKFLMLTALGKL